MDALLDDFYSVRIVFSLFAWKWGKDTPGKSDRSLDDRQWKGAEAGKKVGIGKDKE